MASPSTDRLAMVRAIIEQAPDGAVRGLGQALGAGRRGDDLEEVEALVQAELDERAMRDAVLGPLLGLFSPRSDGFPQALFPATLLAPLWAAIKAVDPQAAAVAAEPNRLTPGADDLCRAGARALASRDAPMAAMAARLEAFRPGAADQLAGFLLAAPLARDALRKAPAWLLDMTGDHAAAARLLFQDAAALAPDGGPRLMEILLTRMPEPCRALRLAGAVAGRSGERFLAASDMAGLYERVLGEVDRHLRALRQFDLDGGIPAGEAAAAALAKALSALAEFEACVLLAKGGPWSQRVSRQKALLAGLAETHLKKTAAAVADALPTRPVRGAGLAPGAEPRLDHAPDARLTGRAMAGLSFFAGVRIPAARGGFGAARARAGSVMADRLDAYLEDVLAALRAGDADAAVHGHDYLEALAAFMALAVDEGAAQIVRRRAAAA